MEPLPASRGTALGLCYHRGLIAREPGVETDVAWVGHANGRIRARMEPLLQKVLRSRGLA